MKRLHAGPICNLKFKELVAAISQYEEQTGRGGTLVYIPEASDERPVVLVNGKNLPVEVIGEAPALRRAVEIALDFRYHPTDEQIRERNRRMNEAGQRYYWEYKVAPLGSAAYVEQTDVPEGLEWGDQDNNGREYASDNSRSYVRRLVYKVAHFVIPV